MARKRTTPKVATVDCCGDCRFWHFNPEAVEDVGICRRFPPTPLASAGCAQPITRANQFCGEHQVRP
ncbi:hypothetical protein [Phenylobacterium sp.]|uniref:hypothetical protein n=1 Tax=Phenylobacterium sp. TaxID=1871053 RepID=UPI002FC8C04A